jgi:hypothetical protein
MKTTGEMLAQRNPLRTLAELTLATVCTLAFTVTILSICVPLLSGNNPSRRDFNVYWATGQVLAQHGNPYDGATVAQVERSAGFAPGMKAYYTRNPPWTLAIVYPLGYLGLRTGWLVWTLLMLFCLAASVHMLWLMHGRPRNRRILLAYSFAPALICLGIGQTAIFALFGLVLFLYLHRRHPFMAGASLWFCALKPHLFLPFCAVLLAWIVVTRSYTLLAGAVVAMAASCAGVYCIDPIAWAQYAQMMRTSGIEKEFIPCLSVAMRLWLSPQSLWLQYLLAALGSAWALSYYWPRRQGWDWLRDGSLPMLVSFVTAPFGWLYDGVVVIPALLNGVYLTRSRGMLAVLALLSALLEGILLASFWKSSHHWTLWSAMVWLVWYLLATSNRNRQAKVVGNGNAEIAG